MSHKGGAKCARRVHAHARKRRFQRDVGRDKHAGKQSSVTRDVRRVATRSTTDIRTNAITNSAMKATITPCMPGKSGHVVDRWMDSASRDEQRDRKYAGNCRQRIAR